MKGLREDDILSLPVLRFMREIMHAPLSYCEP